jgi:chromosome transmission fidelity protein 1
LDNDQENEIPQEEMQVFYCSRTHSQLSQFVKEVNKTVYKNIKAVVIGSRKSTCINQDVLKLKSLTRINDACLDLQKKKVKCKYYSEFAANKNSFVQMAHDSVKDIEELAELGREVNQCSYYGSREAIKSSQVCF